MGRALELISGVITAGGTSFAAMAAVSGNSFTVRDHNRRAMMIALFGTRQVNGAVRITSPSLHDNTLGIQQLYLGSALDSTVAIFDAPQDLRAQDVLTVQSRGSGSAGDIEHSSWLAYYDDLPGVSGNFITPAQLRRRAVNLYNSLHVIAAGTGGGYTGSETIITDENAFKANTDYALLGIQINTNACDAVRVVGPDFGNLGVGAPGNRDVNGSRRQRWFVELSDVTGLPCIPVINTANAGLTTVDVLQKESGNDPAVNLCWAQLK